MPNWKKLIVSGSDAVLNSLSVTNGITGSLLGTASNATQATSASFATTASFYGGSVISASYAATASNVQGGAANYISLFNTATTLSSSVIYQSGSNIGIGTTTPAYKLDVNGTGNFSGALTGTSASFSSSVSLTDELIFLGAAVNTSIKTFASNDRDRLRIRAYNEVNLNSDILLTFTTAGSERMRITSGGNVGIGTTAPGARLDLYASSDLGSGANGIRVQRPGSYGQYGYLEYLVSSDQTVLGSLYTGGGASSFGQFIFRQHSSTTSRDAMVINTSGSVGIGTTSPNAKLDISGSAIITGSLNVTAGITGSLFGTASFAQNVTSASFATTASFYGGSVTSASYAATASNVQGGAANYISLFNTATTLSSSVMYQSGGNIGIGTTSPTFSLDVLKVSGDASLRVGSSGAGNASTLQLGDGTQNNSYSLKIPTGTDALTFLRNATEVMRINSSGNVGIGTTTPNAKLDVSGSAIITGSLNVTAGITGSLFGTSSFATTATTSSYADNFTVAGTLTAQTIVVQTITSSIDFVTGSTRFGSLLANTHQFTGSVSMTGSLTTVGSVNISGSGVQVPLQVSSGSTSLLFVSQSGNVGIGTTSPNNLFSVQNKVYINNDGQLYWGSGLGLLTWDSALAHIASSGGSSLRLSSGGGYIHINSAGNVGIGTTSPAYKLDVSGSANISGNTTITGSLIISQSLIINQNTSSLASGSQTISTNSTSSYTSAFYKYTLASGSNARAGQVMAVWNGANIQYNDVSTNDIGTTLNVALTASLSGGNVLLTTTLPSSGWTIKTQATFI